MPALSHVGLGLAAKRITPKIPVLSLVLSALALDLLTGIFWLAGIAHLISKDIDTLPWSHSLPWSAVWSVFTALLAAWIYRHWRAAVVTGLLVFSHWLLDYLMWPPNAALLYAGGPKIGLDLGRSVWVATLFEFGVLILGLVIYLRTRAAKPHS